jgi:serpin B
MSTPSLKNPGAFLPVVMSLAALALVLAMEVRIMKSLTLTLVLAALLAGPASAQSPSSFACDLYSALSHTEGNLFFSPLSVSTALAMTYGGARGQTAAEMAAVLHFLNDQEITHAANRELLAGLMTNDEDPYQLAIANRLWPAQSLALKQEFLDLTERFYQAEPQSLDFAGHAEDARQTINRWAEENTLGMIRDLLKKGDLDAATLLVLTNAVYFQAGWASPFDKDRTEKGEFMAAGGQTRPVDFMTQQGSFPLAAIEGARLLQMPYDAGPLAFVVILPEEMDGLARLEKALSPAALDSWLSQLKEQPAVVQLPHFELECRAELSDTLQKMGMPSAFGPGADFSGMTDARIYIDQVIHKARIKVDEEGTEAAAATAVIMRKSMPTVFRADRPFLFLIRDTETGAILFMGRLADPTG